MKSNAGAMDYFGDNWKYTLNSGMFGDSPVDELNITATHCYARFFHLSLIDNSADTPTSRLEEWYELFRIVGYRIVLTKADYSDTINAGEYLQMKLSFINNGTAPAYKNYPFYLFLKRNKDSNESPFYCAQMHTVEMTKIYPVDVISHTEYFEECELSELPVYEQDVSFFIPDDVMSGTYHLYFSFEEDLYEKAIQLGNQDKDSSGKY